MTYESGRYDVTCPTFELRRLVELAIEYAQNIGGERPCSREENAVSSTSLLSFDPSSMDVANACMSRRHDFGLLPAAEKKALEFEAREWLQAWGHTLPQFKANAKVRVDE